MKIRHILIAFSFAAAVCFPLSVFSDVSNVLTSKAISTVTSVDADDIFDKTINQNILSPKIGSGQKNQIVEYQKRQAKELIEKGYSVSSTRDGLVLVVTIEADKLFVPNDTSMRASAQPMMKFFSHYLKDAGMWKMLLVMHTDNTGSPKYLKKISEARVDFIYYWLSEKSDHPELLVPYALGGTCPTLPNNSMENREKNRRLEIYLIPAEKMIKLAKENKLK